MRKRTWHGLREDEKETIFELSRGGLDDEAIARRFGTTVGVVRQTVDLMRVALHLRG